MRRYFFIVGSFGIPALAVIGFGTYEMVYGVSEMSLRIVIEAAMSGLIGAGVFWAMSRKAILEYNAILAEWRSLLR